MNNKRFKHKTVCANKKGKIIKREDLLLGRTAYHLEDACGNYVQEITVPFKKYVKYR